MKHYDAVIIGNDIASLSIGTYLARHLRDVLIIDYSDEQKNKKELFQLIGGVNPNSLFRTILRQFNIEKKLTYERINHFTYYELGKKMEIVPVFNKYMLFLIQQFPNDRTAIRKFFKDLFELYKNYINMEKLRLSSQAYTIPNILIEWGNKTLEDVLNAYFENQSLINVFVNISGVIGIDYELIYAPHFFINWFNIFIEGAGYIKETKEEIKSLLLEEFKSHNGELIKAQGISKIHYNNDLIDYVVINDKKKIYSKHFVYSGDPIKYNELFLTGSSIFNEEIMQRYPNLSSKQRKKGYYIELDYSLQKAQIDSGFTLFDIPSEVDIKNVENKLFITEIIDASIFDNLKNKKGVKSAIYVSYIDYDGSLEYETETGYVIDKLVRLYRRPSLRKHIVNIEACKPYDYSSEYNSEAIHRNKSLTELFDTVNLNNIFMIKNLSLVGGWNYPEMGFQAELIIGYVQGEKLEAKLSEEESTDLIENDILISALAHEFKPNIIDKNYFGIQFIISNSEYYFLIEEKHIEVSKGHLKDYDLKITTTNRDLFNVMSNKEKLEDMIQAKKIEYEGNKEDVDKFSDAFNLSQKSIYKYRNFQMNTYRNHIGVKLLITSVSVWMLYTFAINFVDVFYASIGAFVLQIAYLIARKKYDKLVFFDVFSLIAIGGFLGYSILSQDFNTGRQSDFIFLFLSIMWALSWLVGYPLIFGYIKNDYPIEFSNTKLFKIMSGGLTFIWALMFLIMFLINLFFALPYQLISYYVLFLAVYLTFYYPKAYIRSFIG